MRKIYIKPETKTAELGLQHCIALSGGNQTSGTVNPPGKEIDAGEALIHQRDKKENEWGALW